MFYYDLSGIQNQKVVKAMYSVDRVNFVPPEHSSNAYHDGPLPIGHSQTISQPSLVALMTELLHPEAEHKILEIGTGSGYQSAILAEIASEVYTTEIIPELAAQAEERLNNLGYKNIFLKTADGFDGWEDKAPFDSAIITACVKEVPEPVLQQVKVGGRIVFPAGDPEGAQELTVCIKKSETEKAVIAVTQVRFVPMTGKAVKK